MIRDLSNEGASYKYLKKMLWTERTLENVKALGQKHAFPMCLIRGKKADKTRAGYVRIRMEEMR